MADYYSRVGRGKGDSGRRSKRKFRVSCCCLLSSGSTLGNSFEILGLCIVLLLILLFLTLGIICEMEYNFGNSIAGNVVMSRVMNDGCPIRKEFSRPLLLVGLASIAPVITLLCASRCPFSASHKYFNSSRSTSTLKMDVDSAAEDGSQEDDELNWFVRPSAVPVEEGDQTKKWLRYTLYSEIFFSSFGHEMWQFVVPIVFIDIFMNTLLPGALLGAFTVIGYFVISPLLKRLSRWNRLNSSLFCLVVGSICTFCSCVIIGMLTIDNMDLTGGDIFHAVVSSRSKGVTSNLSESGLFYETTFSTKILILFFSLSVLVSIKTSLYSLWNEELRKDWIAIINANERISSDSSSEGNKWESSNNDSFEYIEDVNDSEMYGGYSDSDSVSSSPLAIGAKRVGLLSKVLAPFSTGFILLKTGENRATVPLSALSAVFLWAVLLLLVGNFSLRMLYRAHPEMAEKLQYDSRRHYTQIGTLGNRLSYQRNGLCGNLNICVKKWLLYMTHPMCLASLSYCLLFLTILNKDISFTSYLRWHGIPAHLIGGIWAAISLFSDVGISVAPIIHRFTRSLTETGLIAVWLLWAFLFPATLSVLTDGRSFSATYMICSVVMGRIWFSAFVIIHSQLMEERIEDDDYENIMDVQSSMIRFSSIASYVMVIFHSLPEEFPVLINISTSSTLLGAVIYTFWCILYDRGPYQVVDEIGQLKLYVRG